MLKGLAIVFAVLLILGIGLVYRYGPTVGAQFGMPIYIFPPSPERYGNIAIEIMDRNGYYAGGEQWTLQKEEALEKMETVASYEEAQLIIEEALKVAGGKHSFLLTDSDRDTYFSQDQMPETDRKGNVLYIRLPAIADARENGKEYAETVLKALRDNQDAEGIILDLQDNTGGDMGPMITALSPLLPDGELLSFSFRQYDAPVALEDGVVSGGGTLVETDIEPFKMEVPAAVLINGMTGSSGEATLMSLMELDNVQTFGQPTAGYASANASYVLFDESIMLLTTAYNKTASGQLFGDDPIPPDVETNLPMEEAIRWIKKARQ